MSHLDAQGQVHLKQEELEQLVEQHGAYLLDPETGRPGASLPEQVVHDHVHAELNICLDDGHELVIDPRPLPYIDDRGTVHATEDNLLQVLNSHPDRMEKVQGEEAEGILIEDLLPLVVAEFFPGHVLDPNLDPPMVVHSGDPSISAVHGGSPPPAVTA
jgi:hypothetical protein